MDSSSFHTPKTPSKAMVQDLARKQRVFLAPPIYQEDDDIFYSPQKQRPTITSPDSRPDSPLSASSSSSHHTEEYPSFYSPTPTRSPVKFPPNRRPLTRNYIVESKTSAQSLPSWRSFAFRALIFITTFLFVGQKVFSQYMTHMESIESLHDDLLSEQENLLDALQLEQKQLSEKYETVLKEKLILETTLNHERAQKQQLFSQEKSAVSLQQGTQTLFRKLALEKFGPGPYFIEFQVTSWRDRQVTEYFTIELAPIEDMPVTVYTFMEQVERGLWDDTSFYLNEPHALSARTVSGNGQVSRRKDFTDSGFGSILFRERSAEYAHSAYTLGFSGSGPEFFINKQDNDHDATCFGEVVIGRGVIDRISKSSGPEEDPHRIKPVEINKAKIIRKLSEKALKNYKTTRFSSSS